MVSRALDRIRARALEPTLAEHEEADGDEGNELDDGDRGHDDRPCPPRLRDVVRRRVMTHRRSMFALGADVSFRSVSATNPDQCLELLWLEDMAFGEKAVQNRCRRAAPPGER